MSRSLRFSVEGVQNALIELPDVMAQESLRPPQLDRVYVPPGHKQALSLDATIVVGMRGAGKSLWTAVLASAEHRAEVANRIANAALANADVRIGFGMDDSNTHFPSEDTLAALIRAGKQSRSIWRTIVLRHALETSGEPLPFESGWEARVAWTEANPEAVGAMFSKCDRILGERKQTLLVVFDALDRLSDTWDGVRELMKGALQIALECRSLRAVRCKLFLRPDMEEDESVWEFRDSSKLRHSKVDMSWRTGDLYGLTLHSIAKSEQCGKRFTTAYNRISGRSVDADQSKDLRNVVEAITGPWMGENARRGHTYTWIPTHLSDAVGRVTPRSFLIAFRHAATITRDKYPDHNLPLHYEAIQQGVTKASEIRVSEIEEDYPWVQPLLEAARGLVVPCTHRDLTRRWTQDLLDKVKQGANRKLPPRSFTTDPYRAGKPEALIDDLVELAVLYRTSDGRLNMPDIFRIGVGIKRRGGVKPPR